MPTIEIAGFPLIDGVTMESVEDPSLEASKRIQEWSNAIVKCNGYQAASFGTAVESPTDLVVVIVWDSMEAHITTLRQPEYKAVAERVSSIFTGAGFMHHVDLEPYSEVQRAMAAPVTEIATFYFDDEPPDDYLQRVRAFQEAVGKDVGSGSPIGLAVGITHEELEYEDVKGNAVVLLAGWESVEAHEAFRSSKIYTEHMPALKDGVEKVHVHHVALRKVQAE